MYKDDFYAYWLTVTGTQEAQWSVFVLLEEAGIIGDYLEPDGPEDAPYSSYCYPSDRGSGLGWNEDYMEDLLHDIAIKIPGVTLEIEGENTDDKFYGFKKRFHGDMYQEVKLITYMPNFIKGTEVPFEKRMASTSYSPQRTPAMHLYERMLTAHNENPAAYYTAINLAYLARCVEANEEIPITDLYVLAERLETCSYKFTQPFLNEERLDAVRRLLEKGYDSCVANDAPFRLSPRQSLNFLQTCSDESFAFIVEDVAAYNQQLYIAEGYDKDAETAFYKEAEEHLHSSSLHPTLESRITVAAQRTAKSSAEKQVPENER